MTDAGGSQSDETAPITSYQAPPSPTEAVAPGAGSLTPSAPTFAPPSYIPTVVPPTGPMVTTPAGWYPLHGEQRYWDGTRWTQHTAPAAVPTYRPSFQAPVIMTDARTNGAEVAIAWILTVLTLGYMLPWAIAATRGKSNSLAIGLVNFLLGWTFIGWVAALVMACTSHQVAFVQQRT